MSQQASPRRVRAFAATTIAKLERGRQARSAKNVGPPFTPEQRRRLEDALSMAVNAAMGLEDPHARLGFVARHVAAQDNGSALPAAPPRVGRLNEEQREELAELLGTVAHAINASNCKVGSPLRNVAEHLFGAHRAHENAKERGAAAADGDARARAARRFAMRAAAPSRVEQKFVEPPKPTAAEVAAHDAQVQMEEAMDPLTIAARAAATGAFQAHDTAGSGEIGRKALFEVLLALNQVPGATQAEQEKYLAREFEKADSDGSGTVDFDEFVHFYIELFQQIEAEKAARDAFTRFDVDGSNELEKHELFQVLLELDVVLGDTKADKEAFLAREFADADADGGGTVDFAEFVAFYTRMKKRLRSAGMRHEKAVLQARKDQRALASRAFLGSDALVGTLRGGDVRLVSAKWLLHRAGFAAQTVTRGGRQVTRWVASRKAEVAPLPCRQALERESPEAFLSVETVEALLSSHRGVVKAVKGAVRDGVDAAPVVVVSHCWEGAGHPDPGGRTLGSVAAELGRHFATFVAWGFGDVGVFIDWASIYQDTVEFERTESEAASAERAIGAMPMLFAHRESTVLLIADRSRLEPPRVHRGWPFYEETLTKLFKEAPPPKRYKLPEGPTHLWPKVLRVSDDADPLANDWKAQGPPIAPTEFHAHMTKKVFGREGDREKLLTGYRTTIEHGFSGLERLGLSRRGWSDADVIAFSVAIKEVECPHVTELDLSANDFTAKGVEAVGAAIAAGALHSLRVLDLSDCSGMKSVPETIAQLAELQVLKLDGCIGITTLPSNFAEMAGLKELHLTHCQKLLANAEALAMLPNSVQIVENEKAK